MWRRRAKERKVCRLRLMGHNNNSCEMYMWRWLGNWVGKQKTFSPIKLSIDFFLFASFLAASYAFIETNMFTHHVPFVCLRLALLLPDCLSLLCHYMISPRNVMFCDERKSFGLHDTQSEQSIWGKVFIKCFSWKWDLRSLRNSSSLNEKFSTKYLDAHSTRRNGEIFVQKKSIPKF